MVSVSFISLYGILSLLIFVSASLPVKACMLGPQLYVVSDGIGTELIHHFLSLAHLATTNVEEHIFVVTPLLLLLFIE